MIGIIRNYETYKKKKTVSCDATELFGYEVWDGSRFVPLWDGSGFSPETFYRVNFSAHVLINKKEAGARYSTPNMYGFNPVTQTICAYVMVQTVKESYLVSDIVIGSYNDDFYLVDRAYESFCNFRGARQLYETIREMLPRLTGVSYGIFAVLPI